MPKVKDCLNNKGVTLPELIVSLALFVMVFSAINTLFGWGINMYDVNRDRVEVTENLRIGINRLSRELRLATEFKSFTPSQGGRVSFINTAGNTISYYISTSGDSEGAKQLIRSVNGYGNNPVARYVNGIQAELVITETNHNLLKVTLTGGKGRSGGMKVSTNVRLRN